MTATPPGPAQGQPGMDPAALVAAAKALAGPVVQWVSEDEPLDGLLAGRSWSELAALVIVLAEAVANSDDARRVLAEVAAARDDGEHGTHRARWSRPDDGIIDLTAAVRAVTSQESVPLTYPEKVRAALLILAGGGGAAAIISQLHVNGTAAARLARDARALAAELDSAA